MESGPSGNWPYDFHSYSVACDLTHENWQNVQSHPALLGSGRAVSFSLVPLLCLL